MKSKPAFGITGHLIYQFDGTYCFRVYNEDKTFIDYDLHHVDLVVTIQDHDSAFYTNDDDTHTLDHAPMTLDLKLDSKSES